MVRVHNLRSGHTGKGSRGRPLAAFLDRGIERKHTQGTSHALIQISITVEFLSGPIKSSILRLVTMYRPESLTIGTRGKQVSALEKMLGTTPLGNLSKSLIWQSPVPVIIVRPEDRVKKHLLKRMSDPRRHEYYDLVQHDDDLPMSLPKNKEGK